MKGNKYIAEMLKAYGVTHIFYQDFAMPCMLTEVSKTGIKLILCKSEEGAGYMADGYARSSQKPGIAIAQSIGSANLAAGIHDAWLAGSPVIAMTDKKVCKYQYRNAYQESDHKRLFDATCRFNAFVDDPQEMPRILNQAFREVVTGKPRPAYIDSSGFFLDTPLDRADFSDEVCVNKSFASYPPFRPAAEEKFIKEAATAIDTSEKPVLIIGRGAVVSGAADEIYAIASKGDIPVATTPDGKTIIDETDPLWFGIVGKYGMEGTNTVIAAADLVIYIGCGTNDHTTLDWTVPSPHTKIIQMDIDPTEIGRNFLNFIPILADAKIGVGQLVETINKKRRGKWRKFAYDQRIDTVAKMDAQAAIPNLISPARICYEISKALPDNGIVVSDTGYSAIWSGNYIRMKRGQFYTRAAGSLGWSYPAALGVKCGAPDRPVICFLGDGGFCYHSNEMETAIRCGITTVTVINNNGGLNQCGKVHIKLNGGNEEIAAPRYKFSNVDFGKIAEGFGIWYKHVTSPDEVGPAIIEALSCGRPAIVECISSPDSHPLNPR